MQEDKEVKQSFVMYNTFIDAASNLDDAHFKECIIKIRDYAIYGRDEKSDNYVVNVIMDMAKPLLDAAKIRYDKRKNKKNNKNDK